MSSQQPNPLGYTNLAVPHPSIHRSLGGWIVLLVLWMIGLAVWAAYVTALVYLFFRIFWA